jgi:hypothetical protein
MSRIAARRHRGSNLVLAMLTLANAARHLHLSGRNICELQLNSLELTRVPQEARAYCARTVRAHVHINA